MILLGLAFKFGAGFISGFGGSGSPSTGLSTNLARNNTSQNEMTFRIKGNDLVTVYDNNVNLNNKL